MAFFLTRLNVGDYDAWKAMFDQDTPGARKDAKGHRLFRSLDDPGQVYVMVEFDSAEAAKAGREKLLASGVLDRFPDKAGPDIVELAESKVYN
jgi:hypothetical protein